MIVRNLTAVGLAIVVFSGCSSSNSVLSAKSSGAPGSDALVTSGLNELRSATKAYQVLDSAVAAGYPRDVPDCLVHEHHGAMGYHHVNRGYVDGTVDVRKPEILLYERLPGGQYRLNGVEFIVPYRAWARDSVAPVLMGQKLKHEDNLNIWYLHVWAWTKNEDGVFADFNPVVQCAAGTSKVFKPYVDPAR